MRDTTLLVTISLLLLLFFWSILVYYASQSVQPPPKSRVSSDTYMVTAPSNNPYLQDCPVGECAMNLFNGEKRCPSSSTDVVQSNITVEACTPRERCNVGVLPYALLPDGSVNTSGICQPGDTCRCVSNDGVVCASYITTYFQTVDGNPYVSTNGQRTRFRQALVGSNDAVSNQLNTFCRIPIQWLTRSTPGCTVLPSNLEITTLSPQEITECMNLESPCLTGVLAFVADSSVFSSTDIVNTPLACVTGENCPSGYVNVYDTGLGSIVCESII